MSYSRPPNVVVAGRGLRQSPQPTTIAPPGAIPVSLDADISTTSSLGVVQVGDGLSITPDGILSATSSGSCLINVKLVSYDYTPSASDEYIGCLKKNIVVTLPPGVIGKLYIIKNQSDDGNIKVIGTSGELLDTAMFKTLGTQGMLLALFVGSHWSLI